MRGAGVAFAVGSVLGVALGCSTIIGADFDVSGEAGGATAASGSEGAQGSGASGGSGNAGATASAGGGTSTNSASSSGGSPAVCNPPCPEGEICMEVGGDPRCTCGSSVGQPGLPACTGVYPRCNASAGRSSCECANRMTSGFDSCDQAKPGFQCVQQGTNLICACVTDQGCSRDTATGSCILGNCECTGNLVCGSGAYCDPFGDGCVCLEPGWVVVGTACQPQG